MAKKLSPPQARCWRLSFGPVPEEFAGTRIRKRLKVAVQCRQLPPLTASSVLRAPYGDRLLFNVCLVTLERSEPTKGTSGIRPADATAEEMQDATACGCRLGKL